MPKLKAPFRCKRGEQGFDVVDADGCRADASNYGPRIAECLNACQSMDNPVEIMRLAMQQSAEYRHYLSIVVGRAQSLQWMIDRAHELLSREPAFAINADGESVVTCDLLNAISSGKEYCPKFPYSHHTAAEVVFVLGESWCGTHAALEQLLADPNGHAARGVAMACVRHNKEVMGCGD